MGASHGTPLHPARHDEGHAGHVGLHHHDPILPKPVTLVSGPWDGVYNASDASDAYKKKLYAASNVYRAGGSSSFAMRPPFALVKAAGTLGTAGSRFGDALYEHIADDGSKFSFVFVGGKVYRWDGASTFTDVTPASPAITSATGVYVTSFADNLIVSDGAHKPWYVPSSGCGATPLVATQIEIDSSSTAWAAQGPPAVYGGRLFFAISLYTGVGTEDTIVWSEVSDPGTGYRQDNFANFWQLSQTDSKPIFAIAATEISLVVFRAQSILNITGNTDATFQTNATRENVDGVGTISPRALVVHNGKVWFLDRYGRPYRYTPGTLPEALWPQLADTITASNAAGLSLQGTCACYHPELRVILMGTFGVATSAGTTIGVTLLHVFDAESGVYYGTWDVDGLKGIHSLGMMRGNAVKPALCVLGESTSPTSLSWTASTSGQMWRQKLLSEMTGSTSWTDPNTLQSSVTTHHLGRNEEQEFVFTDLALRAVTSSANAAGRTIPLTYYTPRGSTTPATAVLSQPPSQPVNNGLSAYQGEGVASWGLGPNAQGRWLMATVSCPTTAQTVQPFMPTGVTLTGKIVPAGPAAP